MVRRLAAIALADVAEWTRLVERDDVAAVSGWKGVQHELIEPNVSAFGGRLIEAAGDAVLVEFPSAVDAVRWAVDLLQRLEDRRAGDRANPIHMRVGISIEDAIVDNDKLLGDGVNIASRVHQMAEPDQVIITQGVRDFVWNKLPIRLVDLGQHKLRNISRPVRTFRVTPGIGNGQSSGNGASPGIGDLHFPQIVGQVAQPLREVGGPYDSAERPLWMVQRGRARRRGVQLDHAVAPETLVSQGDTAASRPSQPLA
jgi:class 3 adenylate cyclase